MGGEVQGQAVYGWAPETIGIPAFTPPASQSGHSHDVKHQKSRAQPMTGRVRHVTWSRGPSVVEERDQTFPVSD